MSNSLASLRGRIAAYSRAALPDQARFTEAARDALAGKFALQARAFGACDDVELERRIRALKSAHYSRLALASAKARQKKSPACESGQTLRNAGEEKGESNGIPSARRVL